jgi:hypothetical protein
VVSAVLVTPIALFAIATFEPASEFGEAGNMG